MKQRVRWTQQEVLFLKRNAEKLTIDQLVSFLQKPKENIRYKCWKLRLIIKNPSTQWSPSEIQTLRDSNLRLKELAELLGRSINCVRNKYRSLGLSPTRPKAWTKEETQLLCDSNLSIQDLTELLGRSRHSISLKRKALGIRKKRLSTSKDNPTKDNLTHETPDQFQFPEHEKPQIDIDTFCQTMEDTYCTRCCHESSIKACKILTSAYKGRLPRRWDTENQLCLDFQEVHNDTK